MRTNPTARDAAVARIVRTLLAHQGKRQGDLAAYLDMDSGSMSKYANGRRKWTLDDVEQLAKFFDVSVSVFFEDPETIVRNRWSLRDRTPELALSYR